MKILAISASLALCIGPALTASADEIPVNDPSKGYAYEVTQPSTTYLLPAGGGAVPKTRASNWALVGALKASGTQTITPPSGTAGSISSYFNSNLVSANGGTIVTLSGTSNAAWLGSNPYNATKVGLTDTIWANAIGVTGVSAGNGGWSVSIGVNSSSTSYSTEVSNAWINSHSYSGIQFSGLLLNVNQNVSGAFTFGTKTFFQTVN